MQDAVAQTQGQGLFSAGDKFRHENRPENGL
jgi:hypothetical protein